LCVGIDEGLPDRSPLSLKHILREDVLYAIITFRP
jgi:hypothetical protein